VKRLQNSTNGNPRFDLELHHPGGDITRHRTMSDASASYDVENVHNSGEPVDVELTPKGDVRSIYTKKDKQRTAARNPTTREVHYSEDLHDQAREVHPQAANWWGVRGTGSSKRAQCYICDKDIDSWAGGYPMTKRAQQAVRDHAAVHEGDGQHTAAAKPGQVNYSDPTGANVGRNQSPGAGDWGNTLPEAGDNQSPLTNFPDTGPVYLPSTRTESPETTDYQGYRPNDAPQPVSGQYQASLRTAGLYLAADEDDEMDDEGTGNHDAGDALGLKARSPQGWINDGNADSPDAASSQLLVDWTGDHDPVSYLGVPPVQGYEYNSGRPNGEMFPWSAGPVGSAPTGAAAVWGVPTPGAANLAQEGSSYPQPR
jgi:hypothetical protein